jgi:hypothetical protein
MKHRVFTQPGSKADIGALPRDVRFTTKSRHPIQALKYPIHLSGFFSPFQNLNSQDDAACAVALTATAIKAESAIENAKCSRPPTCERLASSASCDRLFA